MSSLSWPVQNRTAQLSRGKLYIAVSWINGKNTHPGNYAPAVLLHRNILTSKIIWTYPLLKQMLSYSLVQELLFGSHVTWIVSSYRWWDIWAKWHLMYFHSVQKETTIFQQSIPVTTVFYSITKPLGSCSKGGRTCRVLARKASQVKLLYVIKCHSSFFNISKYHKYRLCFYEVPYGGGQESTSLP